MDKELLKIENLTIGFPTKSGIHTVVDHVNLEVGKGEIVGIVDQIDFRFEIFCNHSG